MQEHISILMPVKNAREFLHQCMDSILIQSYKNWELIAVDDGSSDDSFRILTHYAKKDDRIKPFMSQGSGIPAALEEAAKQASGTLFHRMDADDIMPKNKLELLEGLWEEGAIVTGLVKYFKTEGELGEGYLKYENWINSNLKSINPWVDIYKECPIPSPAWLMSRNDYHKLVSDSGLKLPEDYDLAFRMYKSGLKLKVVDEVVHLWRDSTNRTSRNNQNYFPIAYFQMKVFWFLQLEDFEGELILWGAGTKGKSIARELISNEKKFRWITNNPKKHGKHIYDVELESEEEVNLIQSNTIIALSSPKDQIEVQKKLDNLKLEQGQHFWWFC